MINITEQQKQYAEMQREWCNALGQWWKPDYRNALVGSYDDHNAWQDYDHLFDNLDTSSMKVLEYGCGPGRNIIRYRNRFKEMDGCDISPVILEKAPSWLESNNITDAKLFLVYGLTLKEFGDEVYDLVMSTICLQHICVHEIRVGIMKEIYRVLVDNGWFVAQMGFGTKPGMSCGYYDNFYGAEATNGLMDTSLPDVNYIAADLMEIGFKKFNYYIGPVGPGDTFSNWIYFQAQK